MQAEPDGLGPRVGVLERDRDDKAVGLQGIVQPGVVPVGPVVAFVGGRVVRQFELGRIGAGVRGGRLRRDTVSL